MANTHVIFQPLRMASQDVVVYDRSVVLATNVDNGSLVIETVPADNPIGTVASPLKELNTYTATAPAAVATDVILIVDAGDVATVDGWRIGVVDPRYQYVEAGTVARARQLVVGDEFAVSAAAITGTPAVGQYAIPVNGELTFAASATVGTTRVSCQIVAPHTFSVGRSAVAGYRMRVVKA